MFLLLHQGELRLTDYTWLKSRWWDSPAYLSLCCCSAWLPWALGLVVLFCFVCLSVCFFICGSWKLDCWSLKSLSSKISSCFIHYLHPFPSLSLRPLTYPLSPVNFVGCIITAWAGYFPHWAMRLHVSACRLVLWLCGSRCWSSFTRCGCWREGIWLFSFNLACSHYHTEWCWHLMGWREAYGGSPPDSALWVCELYMVIWWDLVEAVILQALCTCLVPWLVRILGEELERELSILCTAWIPSQMSSEEFHQSFHYSSIGIDVCKVLQLGNSLYVYIYFAVFFSVAVTQRPECFGIRRPGLSVASITS